MSPDPDPSMDAVGDAADCPTPEPPDAPAGDGPGTQAGLLRRQLAGLDLHGASGLRPLIEVDDFVAYLDGAARDAGGPADPVERMLLEQMVAAHHAVGRVLVEAASTRAVEAATAYLGAAARLMAEHRETALALREYRSAGAAGLARPGQGDPRVAAAGPEALGPRLVEAGGTDGPPASRGVGRGRAGRAA